MTEHLKAWQCIGCGKIEAPQPCIGVCQDRKIELVYAGEHEAALARLELACDQVSALEAVVRRLAWTKPHAGEWEHSFRALQAQARAVLASMSAAAHPGREAADA
jgi:hypothetical protein